MQRRINSFIFFQQLANQGIVTFTLHANNLASTLASRYSGIPAHQEISDCAVLASFEREKSLIWKAIDSSWLEEEMQCGHPRIKYDSSLSRFLKSLLIWFVIFFSVHSPECRYVNRKSNHIGELKTAYCCCAVHSTCSSLGKILYQMSFSWCSTTHAWELCWDLV